MKIMVVLLPLFFLDNDSGAHFSFVLWSIRHGWKFANQVDVFYQQHILYLGSRAGPWGVQTVQ